MAERRNPALHRGDVRGCDDHPDRIHGQERGPGLARGHRVAAGNRRPPGLVHHGLPGRAARGGSVQRTPGELLYPKSSLGAVMRQCEPVVMRRSWIAWLALPVVAWAAQTQRPTLIEPFEIRC